MSLYILDTDTLSLLQHGDPTLLQRVEAQQPDEVVITVITVHEQVSGWLARLHRARHPPDVAFVYGRLATAVTRLARLPILLYSEPAIAPFEYLRTLRLNVGSQDLRIAAIALEHDGTVVTRNLRDFGRVPHLRCENWAA